MAMQTSTGGSHGGSDDRLRGRMDERPRAASRGKFVILGALMVIAGILCMIIPKMVGVVAVLYLGALLALSGIVELFSGMRHEGRRDRGAGGLGIQSFEEGQHRGLLMGGGLLSFTVGVLLLARPGAGMAAITLLLAGFFFVSGLSALFTSLNNKYGGWRWDLAFGVVALLLGVITIASWPTLALWLVGTLIGIDIVIRGATMLAVGFESHGSIPAPTSTTRSA